MKEAVQVKIFEELLSNYDYKLPLHHYLAQAYKARKQMGSRDRRTASTLMYNYFRVCTALPKLSSLERLSIGCFLCETEVNPLFEYLIHSHTSLSAEAMEANLDEKIALVKNNYSFSIPELFPFRMALSEGVDEVSFQKSFLVRPLVWLRIRKGFEQRVKEELSDQQIPFFSGKWPESIAVNPGTKLETLTGFEKGQFEIQDLSSQQTGNFYEPYENEYWWDCCAGAGGKSLLLLDKEPSVRLTATDVRPAIIENFKIRLNKAGYQRFNAFSLDITSIHQLKTIDKQFDGIIADVPCSGSGTWSRTPEMNSIFTEDQLKVYVNKQRKILDAVYEFLKPGKPLIYSTCSVFKAENEEAIAFLTESKKMKLVQMQVFTGYADKADTLFAARLIK